MQSGPYPTRFRALEAIIDEVAASYENGSEIDNLKSATLPNKRKVIDAFGHLLHVLYVGFFSVRPLCRDNLRQELAEHVYAAHHLLVEQIERALTYERWTGRTDATLPAGSGEEVVLDLFSHVPNLRKVLASDVRAAYDGDPAAQSVEEIIFSYPSVLAVTAYRIAHRLYLAGVPMIPRIITEHAHAQTGIDIHPGARIGAPFFIDHGTGVVIGQSAVIGNNVKLYQGVTLGALSISHRNGPAGKRHPTLEDNVTIYSGATILGGDTVIGAGSVVGGNVWLMKSVPPGSKVFGKPRNNSESS